MSTSTQSAAVGEPGPVTAPRRGGRTAALAVLALAVAAFVGYTEGRSARVVTEVVGCVSALNQIGCRLSDGVDVAVPLEVAWTDVSGTVHPRGRPECLPPAGGSAEIAVRVAWTEVDVDGRSWRQVVAVGCLA